MSTPVVRLKDLCSLITKGTTPTSIGYEFSDDGVGFLRVQNISGGNVNFQTETLFIEEGVHQELRRSQILPGDILLSIAGTIGRTGLVPADAPALNCNQALAIIRAGDKVFRPFLRHWLGSSNAQSQMRGATVTGTIQNLSLAQVGGLQVPLPPFLEQRRIATILDQADTLRATRREALAQLDSLPSSIYVEMFGDPLANKKHLRKLPLGKLLKFKSGDFLPATAMAKNGSYPVFGGNGVNGHHDQFMFSEPKIIVGRVGVYCGCVHVSTGKSWITDNALYVSERDSQLDFNYLAFSLKLAKLNQFSSQSAQPLISGARLYPVEIFVPSIEQQQEFAAIIAEVERLKTVHLASIAELDALFVSIQHRSFQGEL